MKLIDEGRSPELEEASNYAGTSSLATTLNVAQWEEASGALAAAEVMPIASSVMERSPRSAAVPRSGASMGQCHTLR